MKDQIPGIDISDIEQKTENKKTKEEDKKKVFNVFGGFAGWFGQYGLAMVIGCAIAMFIILLPTPSTIPMSESPASTEPTKFLPGIFYKPDGSLDTVMVTVLAVAGIFFFTRSGRRRW